jgi:hypothetical protein
MVAAADRGFEILLYPIFFGLGPLWLLPISETENQASW